MTGKRTIEEWGRLCAALTRSTFVDRLGAPAVLIRLDERGGKNDPAPWAFHTAFGPLPSVSHDDGSGKDLVDLAALRATLDGDTGDTMDIQPGKGVVAISGPNAIGADEETDPVFTRQEKAIDEERTVAQPPPIPIPPARGAATVFLLRKSGRLPGPAVSVGRTDNNDVVLPEMSVSKLHAKIHVDGDGNLAVEDAGSSNGTEVNDLELQPATQKSVKSGDIISFGDVRCLLLDADAFAANLPRFMD